MLEKTFHFPASSLQHTNKFWRRQISVYSVYQGWYSAVDDSDDNTILSYLVSKE